MSVVTNVILTRSLFDDDGDEHGPDAERFLAAINGGAWSEHCGGFTLLPMGLEGGSKFFECAFLIGAFNHLSIEALKDHIRSLYARDELAGTDAVELLYKGQNDDGFTVWCHHNEEEAAPWKTQRRGARWGLPE